MFPGDCSRSPSTQLAALRNALYSAQRPNHSEEEGAADTGNIADRLDHAFKAITAKATRGISPQGYASLMMGATMKAAAEPGRTMRLMTDAMTAASRLAMSMPGYMTGGKPKPSANGRERGYDWTKWPFNFLSDMHRETADFWRKAAADIKGMEPADQRALDFQVEQFIAATDPKNNLFTNPDVLAETRHQGGANLMRGMQHLVEDASKGNKATPSDELPFKPGQDVAVTPGKVVLSTHLMELIQYSPTTDTVAKEPILITPAWIMKYYILDLTPAKSMVRYLVSQGHTVFMISWRNVEKEDSGLAFADYLDQGPLAALEAIEAIMPGTQVHGVGYCLGGTLMAVLAAYLARENVPMLKSLTLMAAQVDFTEAGEITVFTRESDVNMLDHLMEDEGTLPGEMMAGAFQALRPDALIWDAAIDNYLRGKRPEVNALMSWNMDVTRMPAKMHSEYLHSLFLNNDLAEGRFKVAGYPVSLSDINCPVFAVGTEKDHVAPWKSVYKITQHPGIDVTFLLTSGGHNAGIVSEPGHPRRHYRMMLDKAGDIYKSPEKFLADNEPVKGSWWPAWGKWLCEYSTSSEDLPGMGLPGSNPNQLVEAPGEYIFQT